MFYSNALLLSIFIHKFDNIKASLETSTTTLQNETMQNMSKNGTEDKGMVKLKSYHF